MRRADDVFFFTLIDFLIQVFFFGFLLYVLAQAAQQETNEKLREAENLVKKTGVSNITELTDFFTKLAPFKEWRGFADFIASAGGFENIKKSMGLINEHGGPEKVATGLEKLRKIEEGTGKPSCSYVMQGGKRIPQSVGRVRVSDTHVTFVSDTPEFVAVLGKLGIRNSDVKELTLNEFRNKFSALKTLRPDCRYRLDVEVNTQLLAPMDAVWSNFGTARK